MVGIDDGSQEDTYPSTISLFYEPFLRVVDLFSGRSNSGQSQGIEEWRRLLWAIFQCYERPDGVLSSHIRMTYLRRLLCDAGLLKIKKTPSSPNRSHQKTRCVASRDMRLAPMSTSRLELEIEKLLAAAHAGGPLPEGLPCQDIAELKSSTPAILSFGMFQNIIYVISVLCVKPCSQEEVQSVSDVKPLESDPQFAVVLCCLYNILLEENQMPFLPFPPEFRSRDTGSIYTLPNDLPSPFQDSSVLDVFNEEESTSRTASMEGIGLWDRNIDQLKQLYWYYTQLHHGTARDNPRPHTSFLLSFLQCKEFLHDFGILPTLFDYKNVLALYRYSKKTELSKLEEYAETHNRLYEEKDVDGHTSDETTYSLSLSCVSVSHSISPRRALSTQRRAASTMDLTFRGFIEFLTRVALLIRANSDAVTSKVTAKPVLDILGRVKKVQKEEIPKTEDVRRCIGVLLRCMDNSAGKKKLLEAGRRSVRIQRFVFS